MTTSNIVPDMPHLSFTASTSKSDRKASRLYVSVSGENIIQNLENRFDRPVKEYRRLLAPVLQLLSRAVPFNPIEPVIKARWSQKAGCSCGCSPGFILDRKVQLDGTWRGNDIHVTIAAATPDGLLNSGNPRVLR